MNIQPISTNTFKGYDARRLQGFLMSSNYCGIADEMQKIGQKEGFKIYGLTQDRGLRSKCVESVPTIEYNGILWAQDLWTIVKGRLLNRYPDIFSRSIKDFFRLEDNFTQKVIRETPIYEELVEDINRYFEENHLASADSGDNMEAQLDNILRSSHVAGGNSFLINGKNGDELIVGQTEANLFSEDDMRGMFYTDKITVLPQMDYHLDLFIRPLDDKRILLADDNLTLEVLEKIYEKLAKKPKKYADALKRTSKKIRTLKDSMQRNHRAKTDEIDKILTQNGYKTIRVSGRFYYTAVDGSSLRHVCNYMNANVLKNKRGKLVYITNKSNIDKMLGLTPKIISEIGIGFEKMFIKSLSPYVGKEHIYFVDGKKNFISDSLLFHYQGGIHCICTEVL